MNSAFWLGMYKSNLKRIKEEEEKSKNILTNNNYKVISEKEKNKRNIELREIIKR